MQNLRGGSKMTKENSSHLHIGCI